VVDAKEDAGPPKPKSQVPYPKSQIPNPKPGERQEGRQACRQGRRQAQEEGRRRAKDVHHQDAGANRRGGGGQVRVLSDVGGQE